MWDLIRTSGSRSDTLARNQSDQTGSDETSPIVDGSSGASTAPKDFKYFLTVQNAAGPITPFQQGAFAFNTSGFPLLGGESPGDPLYDRPDGTKQQSPGKLTASKGWEVHRMNLPTMSFSYSYLSLASLNAEPAGR